MIHWHSLQCLNLHGNEDLDWDISDLAGARNLREIRLINNRCLTGDTLCMLQHHPVQNNAKRRPTTIFYNLIILDISGCTQVTGKLSQFAKLPKLQWLGINRTQVTGDLRTDIQPGDFSSLQGIGLCSQAVYGAKEIQCVQDAEAVMKARLQIIKQSTWESPVWPLMVYLAQDSSEYHERAAQRLYRSERDPPFSIEVVVVGKRFGWRWSNYLGGFCDTHWVDPEPGKDCTKYWEEFSSFEVDKSMFSGFLDPPTPQRYVNLCREISCITVNE